MLFFEYVRHILEKFIEGNTWLIVSFLGHLVQPFKISDFQDIFVYDKFEKLLRFLYELYVAVHYINFFKDLVLFNPNFLNYKKYLRFGDFSLLCSSQSSQCLSVHSSLGAFSLKLRFEGKNLQASFLSNFRIRKQYRLCISSSEGF